MTVKINENFVLQQVADESIVVPVGEATKRLHGVIKLNSTGTFLWKMLENKNLSQEELVQELLSEFSADANQAREDVSIFVQQLNSFGCLE